MPTRHLPRVLLTALLAVSTPLAASAALVQAAPTEGVAPIARQLPNPDLPQTATAWDAGRVDQPVCGDVALCQEWGRLADEAQAALAMSSVSAFRRPTFVVNIALTGIGVLWAVVTRRRLCAAGLTATRPNL